MGLFAGFQLAPHLFAHLGGYLRPGLRPRLLPHLLFHLFPHLARALPGVARGQRIERRLLFWRELFDSRRTAFLWGQLPPESRLRCAGRRH